MRYLVKLHDSKNGYLQRNISCCASLKRRPIRPIFCSLMSVMGSVDNGVGWAVCAVPGCRTGRHQARTNDDRNRAVRAGCARVPPYFPEPINLTRARHDVCRLLARLISWKSNGPVLNLNGNAMATQNYQTFRRSPDDALLQARSLFR